jgi:hypothetical protein
VNIPWGDWQFWAVSTAAVVAILYIFRGVIPPRWSPFARKRKGKPTSLTIGGRAPRDHHERGK